MLYGIILLNKRKGLKRMEKIFDTHAHYDDPAFDSDRDELLTRLFGSDVCCIVNQGTTIETSEMSLKLAEKYDGIYAAVGIHPECIDENSEALVEKIVSLASHPEAVAIGEIGLDYYYDVPRELQKRVFALQLEAANSLSMPVTVHDREAHGDVLELLKQYRPKGIVHCFSGSAEMAKEIVGMGMYIGMGGVVTFKNARKAVEVIQAIPLESIVLETDCPYLAPVPFRGKRCDSGMILYTAERIAEIKGTDTDTVIDAARKNGERVYGITAKNIPNSESAGGKSQSAGVKLP